MSECWVPGVVWEDTQAQEESLGWEVDAESRSDGAWQPVSYGGGGQQLMHHHTRTHSWNDIAQICDNVANDNSKVVLAVCSTVAWLWRRMSATFATQLPLHLQPEGWRSTEFQLQQANAHWVNLTVGARAKQEPPPSKVLCLCEQMPQAVKLDGLLQRGSILNTHLGRAV